MRRSSSFIRVRAFSNAAAATREKLQRKIDSLITSAPLTHQSFAGRKRFYKHVGVKQIDHDKFGIELDGKTLRTPARNGLHLPTYGLALSIAAEWDAQTDSRKGIEPVTMPMMTLASTAIDQVRVEPEAAVRTCMKYLHTDSALFFTSESDRILLKKQRENLLPAIDWVNATLGTALATTSAMARRIEHPPATVQRLEEAVSGLDHFSLACLQCAVMECKSLVLGLALVGRGLSLEHVKLASRLEEEFQVEIWGVVEGGHDMDRLNNSVSLSSAATFMGLLAPPGVRQSLFHKA